MKEDSFRNILKTLTKPFHDLVESSPFATNLAKGEVSKVDYALFLNNLLILHKKCEEMITSFPEWKMYNIDPLARQRAPFLESDLSRLDVDVNPFYPPSPFIIEWNFAAAVGVLYVLEGSTMGGQFLSRSLEEMRGKDGIPATRYYRSYNEKTAFMWQEYCRFLDDYGERSSVHDQHQTIIAACSLFLYLSRVMNEFR